MILWFEYDNVRSIKSHIKSIDIRKMMVKVSRHSYIYIFILENKINEFESSLFFKIYL